ncbi:transmembrane amino acid transporter protein-domain-containing protein [Xylaria nigripes]|nr:transmembrane amino acid transporter protein-domain-containing protein [Xylaria nigripes]
MKLSVASATAVIGVASAHTIFVQLEADGATTPVSYGIRDPSYDGPITDVTSNDLACNGGPNPTTPSGDIIDVTAGATVNAIWRHTLTSGPDDVLDPSHLGPSLAYLKKVDDATTDVGYGDGWFKIQEDGYSNGVWGTSNVINNAGMQSIQIPDCLPDGQYLLRAELIALHAASSPQGAQLYMECAQINISGGSASATPATSRIPGIYSADDPGLLINIYSMPPASTYTIPGKILSPQQPRNLDVTKRTNTQGPKSSRVQLDRLHRPMHFARKDQVKEYSEPPEQARSDAEVIAEHLPSGYTAEYTGASNESRVASPSPPNGNEVASGEDSLTLQGGDIHRGIFKAATRRSHKRSATFHYPPSVATFAGVDDSEVMTVNEQLAPGGFRRAFLRQNQGRIWASRIPITRDFVEFLDLYGSFAGEDLADTDDEEAIIDEEEGPEPGDDEHARERRPLLGHRRGSRSASKTATASTGKTFFTLLKAFIGTGIMFLPKAFDNGGMLFSSIAMVVVSAVTMLAFHLLLACKVHYSGGYGDIGEAIAGPRMRQLILSSVTLSQLGFVCSGIVFVAENMTSFFEAVSNGDSPISPTKLILIQVLVLIPLSYIRNIAKLGPVALLSDVFILIGVSYIYYYDIVHIASEGVNPTVVLFNPSKYTLMVGSAIFTFEGIGLVLPIQSSMAKPERFEWLLGIVMILITFIFTAVGVLCYATFGKDTSIEIISNYPQTSKFVNAVQFLYSLAVLAGNPVQLFPALRILEGGIFGHRSGRRSLRTKWKKNAFRALLVFVCGIISITNTGNLDKFVALIGSFACVPLVYIYPAYLHYKAIATSRWVKIGDIVFMVLGFVAMVYTTFVTIANSFLS